MVINIPCNTGDIIWFINQYDSVSWGYVVGFTETHIIVWSAYTEYRSIKEFLPMKEWNISISNALERKDAEQIIFHNIMDKENYYVNRGFYCRGLGR